jgi:hypothetical protein
MKHTGSCHCKKVTYEADLDISKPAIECDCSHCSAKGLLLQFIPESSFTLTSGEDSLKEYRFNTHKIAHQFCDTCGQQPFARGTDAEGNTVVSINMRSLDDVEVVDLIRMPYDGKSR